MSFKSGGGDELNAEINVTPMVDVMLVLLIIFMITAPMMNTGVDLELPTTPGKKQEDPNGKLVLSIGKDAKVFLGATEIPWKELQGKLAANDRVHKEKLWIEADTHLPYGVVVTAMAIVVEAGSPGVMLLTDPGDNLKVEDLDAQHLENTKH
jgi:biopolymer transport protein TolR